MDDEVWKSHSSHWGAFSARRQGENLVIAPHAMDPDPSPLLKNFKTALGHKARVAFPAIRRGWLESGPGPSTDRGNDTFVKVSWETAVDAVAEEIRRVKDEFGPEAVFGGSYGWSSAGRFHHAQSQVHRFLNTAIGGYVRSVNSYSAGASAVIIPHVIGNYDEMVRRNVTWEQVADHCDIVLAFGGMAIKNSNVAAGGITRHTERSFMMAAAKRGCRFLSISPLRDDFTPEANAGWLPIVPGTDVALMLALMHTLVSQELHDAAFLHRYCVGWPAFEAYLMGQADDCPKDCTWASRITHIPAEQIRATALSLHAKRVLVTVSHSLQRAEHGEQPVWMGIVLAAVLGQIGLPGGGYAYAMGALGNYGKHTNIVPSPALPQGRNGVKAFIPVARIADMLLNPGQPFRYNGGSHVYPDIRLAYWAGGNPFHHHQDLNRMRKAFARLDTLIVHETAWTATARHADIVLPCTMTLERDDLGTSPTDQFVIAMKKIAEPFAEARDDFDIFADIAERLGSKDAFTEDRTSLEWVRHLYEELQVNAALKDVGLPDFDDFWRMGEVTIPHKQDDGGAFAAFRRDPEEHPLKTPSGKIEIFSDTIASFGEADCPGHPAWLTPHYRPDHRFPLFLVANQPATRLHSQLDFGAHSSSMKIEGREPMRISKVDASTRGIADGDIVKLSSEQGMCLAAAVISEDLFPGVVQLATGAWYDPLDPSLENSPCVHGNPNVLTKDFGTSALAQGCSGQLCCVQVERYVGNLPPIRAFEPPRIADQSDKNV